MHILILSCSTGEYCDESLLALTEQAEARNVEYTVADPVAFGDASALITLDASYYDRKVKRKGTVGGLAYGAGRLYDKTPLLSPVYFSSARYTDRFAGFLGKGSYDAVVATHLYGMEALTALRRRTCVRIRAYGVLTDYAYIPFLKETLLDGYFLPHSHLLPVLRTKGMDGKKLFVTGLPLRARFNSAMGREKARNYLVIPKEKTVYSVFAEGLGTSKTAKIVSFLHKLDPEGNTVYVMTGREGAVADGTRELLKDFPNARCAAYNDRINVYMEASDVIITPPDPFISTEASLLGVPLVHTGAHYGSESDNARFFADRKMAVTSAGYKSAARGAFKLAHDFAMASHMSALQKNGAVPGGAGKIMERILMKNGEDDRDDQQ